MTSSKPQARPYKDCRTYAVEDSSERDGPSILTKMTQTISQTKNLKAVRNDGLEHAFDFDLQASPGKEPFVSAKNREGAFIVNGIGTVRGETIHGKISMSFFA